MSRGQFLVFKKVAFGAEKNTIIVVGADGSSERVDAFWMEVGSGAFARRLQG